LFVFSVAVASRLAGITECQCRCVGQEKKQDQTRLNSSSSEMTHHHGRERSMAVYIRMPGDKSHQRPRSFSCYFDLCHIPFYAALVVCAISCLHSGYVDSFQPHCLHILFTPNWKIHLDPSILSLWCMHQHMSCAYFWPRSGLIQDVSPYHDYQVHLTLRLESLDPLVFICSGSLTSHSLRCSA